MDLWVYVEEDDFVHFPRVQPIFSLAGSYEVRGVCSNPMLSFFCYNGLSSADKVVDHSVPNINLSSYFRSLVPVGAWVLAFADGSLPEDITAANIDSIIQVSAEWELIFKEKESTQSGYNTPTESMYGDASTYASAQQIQTTTASLLAAQTQQEFNKQWSIAKAAHKEHAANST